MSRMDKTKIAGVEPWIIDEDSSNAAELSHESISLPILT
jgi:hypothetical protein